MSAASTARQMVGDDVIRRKCGIEVGEIIAAVRGAAAQGYEEDAPRCTKVALRGDLGHYVVE